MTWSPGLSEATPGSAFAHDAGALVAQDGREQPFRVLARQGELVGVADAGCLDLDQHLAGPRPFELDGFDLQRFAGLKGDGSTDVHEGFSSR